MLMRDGAGVEDQALDSYCPEDDDLDQDMPPLNSAGPGPGGFEDVLQNVRQELKRPQSRKKDPSASAAAGLGAFSGPARVTDAFGEASRKTRQPIPVESWGPRPPSRAGLPQKAGPLDECFHVEPGMLLTAQSRGRGDGASSSAS